MGTGLYVEGPLGSGKTRLLTQEAARLLDIQNTGQATTSVLILCSNHARQRQFINRLAQALQKPSAQWPMYTYAGYVRTMIFNHWPSVETQIQSTVKTNATKIRPALSGMEDTELIVSYLIERMQTEHPAMFAEFPGNTRQLARQIIRRIRLRSENRLSRSEMSERSMLLHEICHAETAELEKQFDWSSYAIRTLDANKQLDVFHRLLESNELFKQELQNIKHLIVDDMDETTPAQQAFIKTLAPQLETLILAADIDGGSRRGYLNAYPYDWEKLKQLLPDGKVVSLIRDDEIAHTAQTLLANWKTNPLPTPLPANVVSMYDDSITRVEMLDTVTEDILRHIQNGGSPGDLCVVFPKTDVLSFYRLKNRLSRRGVPVQLLSGTHRPADNPTCRAFIYLLQLANGKRWGIKLTPWEIKTVLIRILQYPVHQREQIEALAQAMLNSDLILENQIIPEASALPVTDNSIFTERYQKLQHWLEKAQTLPFEKQLHSAFSQLVATGASEQDRFEDLSQIIESHERQKTVFQALNALHSNNTGIDTPPDYDRWWLQQIKNGSIANTPETPDEINPEAIVTGTPQKMIDFEVQRPIQFWLDVSSREWARSDNAPLYNAWVHSAVWDFSDTAFSEAFNEKVIRARAGHITRTLTLLAGQKIHAYASDLDDLGFTHTGLLKPLLITDVQQATENNMREPIELRPDQKPILDYTEGTMAITAVPGAGKTFVNVALILDLIQKNIPAEQILVLTYMDSAAKTLLSRLKKQLAGISNTLPAVSTIHSLAFRILTENDHALLLNLSPDDMRILDDYQRAEVLQQVAGQTTPQSVKSAGNWAGAVDRAISHAKSLGISAHDVTHAVERSPQNFRLGEFLPAYKLYTDTLRENGFLDFTDLIVKAIQILEDHPDIRARYQQQFKVIIEDEAQDSSKLLQRFINLIGGEKPNLIRTGDTNQSITTTFSSADTSVFRQFIATADKTVSMDRSSRCAPEVLTLANQWIHLCSNTPGLENAFKPVDIQPVPEKNPTLRYPLTSKAFDLSNEEDQWLADEIKAIKTKNPEATIAVLARSNGQVSHLTSVLHHNQIAAVSHSEQLNLNPVFQMVLNLLKLLEAPGDLTRQFAWYETLVQTKLIDHTIEHKTFFETEALAYKHPDQLLDETLLQLYYDILEYSHDAAGGNIATLIVKIIDRFFSSVEDKSNGYLCALLAEEVLGQYGDDITSEITSPLETVITRFEDLRRSYRGKKSFSELLTRHPARFVHVMSLHKAKGQEFDVVFMPYLQKESFPSEVSQIRFDESDKLQQELEKIAVYKISTNGKLPEDYIEQKKLEKVEEEARLIYVGLTRAKQALFLSCHAQAFTKYGKLRPVQPAFAFTQLQTHLQASLETEVPVA